ncbi:uncharacterized protein L3040_003506 [Drepanopeziza brunnea f. sp. 'multigermtubi']|uniref:Uncharacterized protein n=1 Tax=Marssonina brunnea f. sp. multigermtubi (strain MB_m1) TaxID=1072389 RepID=K1WUE1_MARBU|nr:uncharacterized protein MBM_06078 [Drepanopeziza brunnea f. sp. 'multigermtubi' MB_m1]EKD16067.1 hypothetical protein MBM_06078 [Drepanopeziza brunnea f. sp. 'multigermtubi' MB_m1]KAJ5047687.1 hypothetical protein L3040_003506 [Drepanopeziza brunnea f. sp. 'multigermtubi']
MLRSKSTLATLLALGSLFNGAQGLPGAHDQVIGYAKVSSRQAQRIIMHTNRLPVEESRPDQLIGPGFYMMNKPDWDVDEEDRSRYCVIKANKKKMEEIEKVWVPKSYEQKNADGETVKQNLWGEEEEVILEYIQIILDLAKSSEASTSEASTSEVLMPKPERVLRFSSVPDRYWLYQMNIPTELVNDNDLELRPTCFESVQNLKENYGDDRIDWRDDWKIRNAGVWQ